MSEAHDSEGPALSPNAGKLMFDMTHRKVAVALAAALAALLLPAPGLAVVDHSLGAPDHYRVDLDLMGVQALLTEKGFYRGAVDGIATDGLADAILAFHKAADLERTTTWMPHDAVLLSAWEPQVPDLPDQPDRLEVDIERQVMHLLEGGEVVATLPVSTGSGRQYVSPRPEVGLTTARTPRGSYLIERYIHGWRYVGLGGLYRPWYFDGPYALHGSLSVPAYPDSHGCVRLTVKDADWLSERLSIGFRIIVRETIPRTDVAPIAVSRPFLDPLGMFS